MTRARRRGPRCFSTSRVMGLAKPIWNSFFPAGPLLDMSRPSGRGLDPAQRRRGCDGILGGRGVWGHAVIFAGDRRLKARERGASHGAGSVWLRVAQKHFCFSCSHLPGCPPPGSRQCGPYSLASQNPQWLSQPHRIVYANTPPKPKPLGRAGAAHWNVRDLASCGTNACCSADLLPCRTPR